MCIGIPMQVLEMQGGVARCDDRGRTCHVDMSLVGEQQPGSWVMTFLGAAREVIDAEAANASLDAIEAVERVMQGDLNSVEQLFADLIDREPQLPDHLKKTTEPTPAEPRED